MKKRENLFLDVLEKLQEAGALEDLVLIGSFGTGVARSLS